MVADSTKQASAAFTQRKPTRQLDKVAKGGGGGKEGEREGGRERKRESANVSVALRLRIPANGMFPFGI